MKILVERPVYLKKLIDRKNNGEIKIITGSRRCGKSWLLTRLYKKWLLSQNVNEENIIILSFDMNDEQNDERLLDHDELKKYLYGRIKDDSEEYYVFLDEIQELENFERIVNGLNSHDNVDVYITGSNSKFLSSDINTLFRGRGDEVRVYPLSFKEFCSARTEDTRTLWKEYYTYGGLPSILHQNTKEQKIAYLQRLWSKTYIDDVQERNNIKNRKALDSIVDALCSSVGSLSNPSRIRNILETVMHIKLDGETIKKYIEYLQNAYLFEEAQRYNIKGNKYYDTIKKYYAVDIGLRNAKLNFRQQELTHIMENIIYNELRMRNFLVDVGVVETRKTDNGKSKYIQYEVDFVATNGIEKYYIQSAYAIPDEAKREQETASLRKIGDSFRKIVIVNDDIETYTDNNGIVYLGLLQFLMSDEIF
ncbi:MAG: ATP-binding protein [Opitutales bacterium]|nr:ATP-binding protein [Opitutales bacterium]